MTECRYCGGALQPGRTCRGCGNPGRVVKFVDRKAELIERLSDPRLRPIAVGETGQEFMTFPPGFFLYSTVYTRGVGT